MKGGEVARWLVCTSPPGDAEATGLVPHLSSVLSLDGPRWKERLLSNLGQNEECGIQKGERSYPNLDAKAFRKEGMEWEEHGAKGGGYGHDDPAGPLVLAGVRRTDTRNERGQYLFLGLCAFRLAHRAVKVVFLSHKSMSLCSEAPHQLQAEV